VAVREQLAWKTTFTWDDAFGEPEFGGTGSGEDAEIFLCRAGPGERGTWASWSDPADRRAVGVRAFHLRHPDGHTFRVGAFIGG
jgi:hypothetical protein